MNPVIACSRCPHSARRCVGPCACTLDGKDIVLHQKHAYCPDGRFGAGVKPDGWDAIENAPPSPPPRQNDIGAVKAVCLGCEFLSRVQDHGMYVECDAMPKCCGGGVGEVSLISGACPKGKWN